VAAHGRVVAVRVLRAIPSRVVARVTVSETVTEVVAKKNAAEAEYGAAPESTKLPIEARIEVPEGTPPAEVPACERMPSAKVASTTPMPAAFVSARGHGELCNPDGERGGSGEAPLAGTHPGAPCGPARLQPATGAGQGWRGRPRGSRPAPQEPERYQLGHRPEYHPHFPDVRPQRV
jgi:hypothetical protein